MNKKIWSWCLYDWANSVLATIIFTFVFSVYFSRSVVGDEILGSAYWGYAIGTAGFTIAILAPILGAASDVMGSRKPMLMTLTSVTILATTILFFVMPDPSFIAMALIVVAIATIGFELAQAQYNPILSEIAPRSQLGRVSGIGWAMGYGGGLVCLIIALIFFVGLGDTPNLLGLSEEQSLNIRATCLLAAGWYCLFSIPLFLYVPDRPKKTYQKHLIKRVQNHLGRSFKTLTKTSRNTARFLIASAIYRDGLNTLFTVGGLYAAGTFGMNFQEILIFAIGLNITAGCGAFAFGFIDDKIGAKKTIIISLIALIILGLCIMIVHDKMIFMVLALILGFFIGPVQSSSRSLLMRLSPPKRNTELAGFYAMTGKSIAFTGPLAFAFLTQMFDSQRAGISAIIILWILGLFLMMKVKEKN